MENKEIQDLIKLINKTNIAEFKMKKDDFEIVVRTNQYRKPSSAPPISSPNLVGIPTPPVQQPMVAPPPASQPEVSAQAPAAMPDLPPKETKVETTEYLEVKSPIVGTFYRSASPDKPPFIKVGDTIAKGDTVCIVEAMKLFNEIESEVSGKVVKVMLEDASPVQYDQVLFLVDPKG